MRCVLALAVVLGSFVGCGGDGSSGAPPDPADADDTLGDSDMTYTLSASDGVLVQEGSATVTLTLTRGSSFTDPVTLSLGGGPLGVTGSFDPPQLTGAVLTSTLTLHADADSPTGAQSLTVHADAPGQHISTAVSLQINQAAQVSIEGIVYDLIGTPRPGVSVKVSPTNSTTTDASGHFTLSGVARPYTVLVADGSRATAYAGLRHAHGLRLVAIGVVGSSGGTHSSDAAGSVSGIATPLAANQAVTVLITGPGIALDPVGAAASDTSFSRNVAWDIAVGTTTPAQFAAMGYTLDAGTQRITNWLGFGQVDMTLTDGVGASMTIPAAAVTTAGTVNATMAVTGVPTQQSWTPVISVDGSLALPIGSGNLGASTSLPLPTNAGVQLGLLAQSYRSDATELATTGPIEATGDFNVTVPPAPARSLPVDGAVDVTAGTSFTWSGVSNAIYVLRVQIAGDELHLVTSAPSITLSDVKAAGYVIAASGSGAWSAYSIGPATSVDDAAVMGTPFFSALARLRAVPASLHVSFSGAESSPRSFTTSATP